MGSTERTAAWWLMAEGATAKTFVLGACFLLSGCQLEGPLPVPADTSPGRLLRRAEARGKAAPDADALRAEAVRRWITDRAKEPDPPHLVCLSVSLSTRIAPFGQIDPPPPPEVAADVDDALLYRLGGSMVLVQPASDCWQAFSRSQELAGRWAFVDIGPITRWWLDPEEFELELAVLEFSAGPAEHSVHLVGRYTAAGWVVSGG